MERGNKVNSSGRLWENFFCNTTYQDVESEREREMERDRE